MKRLGFCMGCMVGRIRGSAHHQEGEVDSFFVPRQESMWTHRRYMSTTKELLMGCGKEKVSVLIQKLAMLTCGKKKGRVAGSSLKRKFGGRGARQDAPHKERQESDVAF